MDEDEITIPKIWLEQLIRYAVRAAQAESVKGQNPSEYNSSVNALIGYASSAETILKYQSNKTI